MDLIIFVGVICFLLGYLTARSKFNTLIEEFIKRKLSGKNSNSKEK